ncbi:MAG TPA: hypothetical protein VN968_21670 [Bradyrhizobium sp.]|nr:hypothetical protein [Bradyrhizobium sp.]
MKLCTLRTGVMFRINNHSAAGKLVDGGPKRRAPLIGLKKKAV